MYREDYSSSTPGTDTYYRDDSQQRAAWVFAQKFYGQHSGQYFVHLFTQPADGSGVRVSVAMNLTRDEAHTLAFGHVLKGEAYVG